MLIETLVIIEAVREGKKFESKWWFSCHYFPTKMLWPPPLDHVAKAPVFTTHALKIFLIISVMLKD